MASDLGTVCGFTLPLGASATMGLANTRGFGQGDTRRHAELVDTGGIQVGRVRQPLYRLDDEATCLDGRSSSVLKMMGCELAGTAAEATWVTWRETGELTTTCRIKP